MLIPSNLPCKKPADLALFHIFETLQISVGQVLERKRHAFEIAFLKPRAVDHPRLSKQGVQITRYVGSEIRKRISPFIPAIAPESIMVPEFWAYIALNVETNPTGRSI